MLTMRFVPYILAWIFSSFLWPSTNVEFIEIKNSSTKEFLHLEIKIFQNSVDEPELISWRLIIQFQYKCLKVTFKATFINGLND